MWIDRHPALIVKPAGTSDVVSSVNFARENGLPLAVKGGGHNVAGNAVCDDGLVIDFSNMRSVRVDPKRMVARAEAGATWGDYDRETQLFGMATPGGLNSTTGLAGFTLGGGIGWLMSKYGLTCDNLISADVITADGKVLLASEKENSDLFWGIRGGGGNFGVVTSFELKVHPVRTVLGGPAVHLLERANEVLRFMREFDRNVPDELGLAATFRQMPDGSQAITLGTCYHGDVKEGEKVLAPLRRFGPPKADLIKERPYAEFQTLVDPMWPKGLHLYWKSGFFEKLSDEIIETVVAHAKTKPSPISIITILLHHGVASRIKPKATAFNHRARLYNLNIQAQWPDPADTEKNLKWIRDFWSDLEPMMTGRVYVNFLSEEGDARVRAAYGENYDRLVALKNKYDPTNLFRFNQNIKPTNAA